MHHLHARLTVSAALAVASAWIPVRVVGQGPSLQSLNPDISAIGDFITDLSPDEPRVNGDEGRFSLREIELGVQAVVDPFFRADFFLGVHGEEVDVEEAYLTALSLPGDLQARLGRIALPVGKVNLTHRSELLTPDYPLAIRSYFGPEGLTGTGIGLSRIFAPFGFFQELQLLFVNGDDWDHGENDHGHSPEESGASSPTGPVELAGLEIGGERRGFEQLAVLAHLRSFYDFSVATNLEVGVTAGTGSVERLRSAGPVGGSTGAVVDLERTFRAQSYYGVNAVVRWRPPQQAIYESFIWSAEWLKNVGPKSSVWGGFTHTEWQLGRRTYVGGRLDAAQTAGAQEIRLESEGDLYQVELDAIPGGEWMYAAAAGLTFFPSEFSRFRLWIEHGWGEGQPEDSGNWRAVFQTTFSIGAHRPHPF